MIKITVIIPVYNVEHYLNQCLDSVLNQSLKEIELVIVDDGSTDNSKSIIQEYEKKYDNIISLYQKNQGSSVARNLALEKANGEYVYYMDSDDFLEIKCLEMAYDKAKKSNSDIVIFAHNEVYNHSKNEKKSKVNIDIDDNRTYSGLEVADMVLNCKFIGTAWNKLFKRSELIKHKFFFEVGRYVQDWYPIFIQICKSDKISFINIPLYNYRIREGAITSKNTKKNIDDYNHAASQIIEYALRNKFNDSSILKFKAIALNTIICRYYNLNLGNTKKLYSNFKKTEYYQNRLTNMEVLKVKGIPFRTRINLIFWNMNIYHLVFNIENKLRSLYKNLRFMNYKK